MEGKEKVEVFFESITGNSLNDTQAGFSYWYELYLWMSVFQWYDLEKKRDVPDPKFPRIYVENVGDYAFIESVGWFFLVLLAEVLNLIWK